MRLLFVSFSKEDVIAGAGLAETLGCPFDIIELSDHDGTAEELAPAISMPAYNYTHLAAVSSMRSKDVLARVAGLLDCAMVTDVISCDSPTVFKRPIVAGTMIETVEASGSPIALTFRPAGFPKPATQPESSMMLVDRGGPVRRVEASKRSGGRPDLSQAKVIVSGGRPLKDAATFESVIGGLADALGGAVGATRAAVDSGIAPNELQVGQTGKIVAPDLYIAAGISGSTQHMAGIKDSKIIVAINKDPDAPIFEFADLGLVADLFDAIPAIRAKLG
jgi:electron transfer flavoprotein alpha subunit